MNLRSLKEGASGRWEARVVWRDLGGVGVGACWKEGERLALELCGASRKGGLLLAGQTEGTGASMNPGGVSLTLPLFPSAPQDSLSLRPS